ncbi:MAG: RIP metalloprotease RseP [Bdellovibrionales bacterium]
MDQIVSYISSGGHYLIPFLVVLGIVVFVHEFGHFWVARRCGVKVETFSIGFGPEICAWHDRHGTRWRLAWLPLGGYVKMFGDADPSSFGPGEAAPEMTTEEKKVAFFAQNVRKRFAIVAAGPGFNYGFAILVLAVLFMINGQPFTSTLVSTVMEDSAAKEAGFLVGDKILSVDGDTIESFEKLQQVIALNTGTLLQIKVERDGQQIDLPVTPRVIKMTDRLGGEHTIGRLGLASSERVFRDLGPWGAIRESVLETWHITTGTLKGVGQMILGVRSADELGGPLRIAEMSGKVAQDGVFALVWFIVIISINLGLINLFPIPLLDGGHLLFYLLEGLRGRPVSERIQEYGARAGALMVLSLMVFATWNDLVHLRVVSFVRGLFS